MCPPPCSNVSGSAWQPTASGSLLQKTSHVAFDLGGKESAMFAQMKHLAIVSDNLEGMCRFYERAFGMRGTGV
jgi:hypothetical protein